MAKVTKWLILLLFIVMLASGAAGVYLIGQSGGFDRRVAMLLSLIAETSSVRMACHRMQLSYSSGWSTINSVEEQLGYPLVERSQGGARGGKSVLTPAGRELLRLYELFERDVKNEVEELFEKYFSGII